METLLGKDGIQAEKVPNIVAFPAVPTLVGTGRKGLRKQPAGADLV